jgi:hypothetical protein
VPAVGGARLADMSLNKNDAMVAMRSLGRRYGEVVNGPVGDDAWERKVRAAPPKGHSALAYVAHATATLAVLASAVSALPNTKEPLLSLPTIAEPNRDVEPMTLVAGLKSAGAGAAAALDARSHDDYHRTILVNGTAREVREVVADLVTQCVGGLKLAQHAIDSAD